MLDTEMSAVPPFAALYESFTQRPMPETIAKLVLDLPEISTDVKAKQVLGKVASARAYSYMSDQWFTPVACNRQLTMAHTLFAEWIARHPGETVTVNERDPEQIAGFIGLLNRALDRTAGQDDFLHHRLLGADRGRVFRPYQAKNAYNKRFRFLVRLEEKLAVFSREMRLLQARVSGKGGLITGVSLAEFSTSPWAAAFVSYYVARKARRSEFTNESQSRPFDTIAQFLLERALDDKRTQPLLIARVYPEPEVVARLSDLEKGMLLGMWAKVLEQMSSDLKAVWEKSNINIETMVVQRGNDSTTWNLLAQSWNTARNAWMVMLESLGYGAALTEMCPGKVLRLIAGDVAYWHKSSGGDLQPDTKVWRLLPKPWEVFTGQTVCTMQMVEQACVDAGVDARKTGWIEGRVATHAVAFEATPDLVHGVTVSSPFFALILRKAGVFSGKPKSMAGFTVEI